jgi:hypothetical protein
MPADSQTSDSIEQQALNAIAHLPPEDKKKILEYIHSIINLEKVKNDQGSSTQD